MPNRVALVTNATTFLGPPAVKALAEADFSVLAHDPAFSVTDVRRAFVHENPGVEILDALLPEDVVAQAWGKSDIIHAVVSNDSYPAIHSPVAEAGVENLKTTLDKVLVFPFALMKAAIPRLRSQQTGRLVMVTSCRTQLPMLGGAIRDSARAAANALVKQLGLELAPDNIPVNAVAPNFVYSETYFPRAKFVDNPDGRAFIEREVPTRRLGRPEEAGELIRYPATLEGTFMTGTVIDLAGGWPAAPFRPE